MAELADALDSKSGALWACGFDSHLRYHFFLLHIAAHLAPLLLLSIGRVRWYTPAVVHCKNTTCARAISQKSPVDRGTSRAFAASLYWSVYVGTHPQSFIAKTRSACHAAAQRRRMHALFRKNRRLIAAHLAPLLLLSIGACTQVYKLFTQSQLFQQGY